MGYVPIYRVAETNEILVITGAGIKDVRIVKKAFVFSFQKCAKISIAPFDFSINLHAMTIEKLQFALPAVFTIGPHEVEALRMYALLLSGDPEGGRSSQECYLIGELSFRTL